MKLDEAITMALQFERYVFKAYFDAMEKTEDKSAKRMFKILADEEQSHIDYLQDRLREWKHDGKIVDKQLVTTLPTREVMKQGLMDLRKTVLDPKPAALNLELELLKAALEAEVKTSNFYKDMVAKLDGDGQKLFRKFVEIEKGHEDIVQAQIDCASGLGVFLDTMEFGLEVE
jgi:rubrerythrin